MNCVTDFREYNIVFLHSHDKALILKKSESRFIRHKKGRLLLEGLTKNKIYNYKKSPLEYIRVTNPEEIHNILEHYTHAHKIWYKNELHIIRSNTTYILIMDLIYISGLRNVITCNYGNHSMDDVYAFNAETYTHTEKDDLYESFYKNNYFYQPESKVLYITTSYAQYILFDVIDPDI